MAGGIEEAHDGLLRENGCDHVLRRGTPSLGPPRCSGPPYPASSNRRTRYNLVVQAAVGNIPATQAHFDGLTMLLELRDSARGGPWTEDSDDDELTERYAILYVHGAAGRQRSCTTYYGTDNVCLCLLSTLCYVSAILSRLRGSPFLDGKGAFASRPLLVMPNVVEEWHDPTPADGMALASLRLILGFCSPAYEGKRPHAIDASALMDVLRSLSTFLDRWCVDASPDTPTHGIWSAEVGRVLYHLAETNVLSYREEEEEEEEAPPPHAEEEGRPGRRARKWMTSWRGIAIATHLYTYGALGIQHLEPPALRRLSRRLLVALERDVAADEDGARAGAETARRPGRRGRAAGARRGHQQQGSSIRPRLGRGGRHDRRAPGDALVGGEHGRSGRRRRRPYIQASG